MGQLALARPAAATFPGGNLWILIRKEPARHPWWGARSHPSYRVFIPRAATVAEWAWGDRLAVYVRPRGSRRHGLYILDQYERERTRLLTQQELPGRAPEIIDVAFAPSAGAVAFCASYRGGHRTYTIDIGSRDLTLISGDRDLCYPDWSFKDRIVASTPGGPRIGLFTMDPDGSHVREIVRLAPPKRGEVLVDAVPSWSPDGQTIAFQAQAGRLRTDIWIVKADGTGLRRVTDTPWKWELSVVFAPEGASLAVGRAGRALDGERDVRIIDLEGGTLERITDTPGRSETVFSWMAL